MPLQINLQVKIKGTQNYVLSADDSILFVEPILDDRRGFVVGGHITIRANRYKIEDIILKIYTNRLGENQEKGLIMLIVSPS